jgi:rhamnosyltransferase
MASACLSLTKPWLESRRSRAAAAARTSHGIEVRLSSPGDIRRRSDTSSSYVREESVNCEEGGPAAKGTSPKPGLAAVIVAFMPAAAQITRLIEVLAQDCETVLVLDNGGGRDAISAEQRGSPRLRIVDMGGNRGIGEALNRGFQLAKLQGAKYVATFDQDSDPAPGLARNLAVAYELLVSKGIKVSAVGPKIVDVRIADRPHYPFMRRRFGWPTAVLCTPGRDYLDVDFLITSGCLISTSIFEVVGQFAQALFVDCVDMEWCFRASSQGYRPYAICSLSMLHEVGTGVESGVLGMTVLGHSPARRYYYARNTVLLLKRRYVAIGWKARMLLGLAARTCLLPFAFGFANGWTADWLMLARGIADGIAGVGGACRFKT